MKNQVLQGYRRLLRAASRLFKGDDFALNQARRELRFNFEKNRNVSQVEQIKIHLGEIEEAADMLENHFVQAKVNDRGNYEVGLNKGGDVSLADTPIISSTKDK